MFERYMSSRIIPHTVAANANVSITEKRAPTDDSVKLLREMEEKARAEVIRSIYISDNQFRCVIQHIRSVCDNSLRTRIIYDLNGQRHTVDDVQRGDVDRRSEQYVSALINTLAHDLTMNLLLPVLKKGMA